MSLPEFWLEAPQLEWPPELDASLSRFHRNEVLPWSGQAIPSPLPCPVWMYLMWLSRTAEVVFHGSGQPDIEAFEPRTPKDHSADAFSKQKAVFASGDPLWALFYAVLNRDQPVRFLNGALQFWHQNRWSSMRYFFSLNQEALEGSPWRPGTLYILPKGGFKQQPAYLLNGQLVLEPHFACADLVRPLAKIQVVPQDFPLLSGVRGHHQPQVDFWAVQDPEGFPWLNPDGTSRPFPDPTKK